MIKPVQRPLCPHCRSVDLTMPDKEIKMYFCRKCTWWFVYPLNSLGAKLARRS